MKIREEKVFYDVELEKQEVREIISALKLALVSASSDEINYKWSYNDFLAKHEVELKMLSQFLIEIKESAHYFAFLSEIEESFKKGGNNEN